MGSEAVRHRVFEAFETSHGTEVASDLMELLPPAGVPELATKDDLALLRAEMAGEFAAVRGEMATEFAAARGEMATEFAAVRGEMATLLAAVRGEMQVLDADLRESFASQLHHQTNRYVAWLFAGMAFSAGIAGAVARFAAAFG